MHAHYIRAPPQRYLLPTPVHMRTRAGAQQGKPRRPAIRLAREAFTDERT